MNKILTRAITRKNILKRLKPEKFYSKKTAYEKISENKGWVFDSPNLLQYKGLKGSLWSIGLRAFVLFNAVMLVYEYVFYPYDLQTISEKQKVE